MRWWGRLICALATLLPPLALAARRRNLPGKSFSRCGAPAQECGQPLTKLKFDY